MCKWAYPSYKENIDAFFSSGRAWDRKLIAPIHLFIDHEDLLISILGLSIIKILLRKVIKCNAKHGELYFM